MTKTQQFTREIQRKRREITRMQSDLNDMLDHLTVLESRAASVSQPNHSLAEIKARFGLTARKKA